MHFFNDRLETGLNNAHLHTEDADRMIEFLSNIYENYLIDNIEMRNRLVSIFVSNILKVITDIF